MHFCEWVSKFGQTLDVWITRGEEVEYQTDPCFEITESLLICCSSVHMTENHLSSLLLISAKKKRQLWDIYTQWSLY